MPNLKSFQVLAYLACHVWCQYLFLSKLGIFNYLHSFFKILFYYLTKFISLLPKWAIGDLDYILVCFLFQEISGWRGLFPISTKLSRPPSHSPLYVLCAFSKTLFLSLILSLSHPLLTPLATSSFSLTYALRNATPTYKVKKSFNYITILCGNVNICGEWFLKDILVKK